MSLFVELNNLMVKYRFKPSKKFGQNFIINEKAIERILRESNLKQEDTVLEIGAGTGFLTRELQKHSKVIAVEIEKGFCELLQKELPQKNLLILNADFLHTKLPEFNKVVAFPPYNLSKKIILKLLREKFSLGILVFQAEFVEKLIAQPGFSEFNALSVLTQYHFNLKPLKRLKPNSFFPKPKSDSIILRMKRIKREKRAKDEEKFEKFIEQLFRYKNKNLSNALHNAFPSIKKELELEKREFDSKIHELKNGKTKVMLLSIEELVELFNSLLK